VRSKRIRNHIASWVFVERTTGQPQMQVGFQSWQRVKKRGKLPSHANPHWLEFGTATHTIAARNAKVMAYQENIYGKVARHGGQREGHILRNAVHDNIAEIRAAQEKFLEALSGELDRAKGMMQQDSEEPEDD
jgi:hypothetical protein